MELKHTIYEQLLPWLWCIDCCKLITGSLMKTATVCRNICISVIVLSVKEMAQSTRHLKWTRYHLRWTFVYLDGHYKNLFGTWTSLTLNHQLFFIFFIPPPPRYSWAPGFYLQHTHPTHMHSHNVTLFPGSWFASISLCSNCRTHLSKPKKEQS